MIFRGVESWSSRFGEFFGISEIQKYEPDVASNCYWDYKENEIVLRKLGRIFNIMGQIRGAATENKANFEIDAYKGKKKAYFRIEGSLDQKSQK